MELRELEGAIEGILFAAGEPVRTDRIAAVLGVDPQTVEDAALHIADRLEAEERGIRLVRLDNMLQLCSAAKYADTIRQVLETRKPPRLSPASLEVLAIVAYFQPVTRAYIESVRGVDSSYTVSLLMDRGLIETCGHLDAPGRPTLFRTTPAFLRTFAISSLGELPPLPEEQDDEEQLKLRTTIEALEEARNLAEAEPEPAPETRGEEGTA